MSAKIMSFPDGVLFDAENEVRSVADRLLLLEIVLGALPRGLSKEEARAVCRLVGDAASDARAVEIAWDISHRGAV